MGVKLNLKLILGTDSIVDKRKDEGEKKVIFAFQIIFLPLRIKSHSSQGSCLT